jgi:hypothetical protein
VAVVAWFHANIFALLARFAGHSRSRALKIEIRNPAGHLIEEVHEDPVRREDVNCARAPQAGRF